MHYNAGNSDLFVNGKVDNKNVDLPNQYCLGSISNGFSATKSTKVSLYGYVYDFSTNYNSIEKSDILNTHKYLAT